MGKSKHRKQPSKKNDELSNPSTGEPFTDSSDQTEDSGNYHQPVLLKEAIDGLNIRREGVYVDCTFGGGGHSAEILKRLGSDGKLFVFDQDADAKQNVPDDRRVVGRLESDAFPETAHLLGEHVARVIPVTVSEFAKAEGGVTCMSLVFRTLGA